MPDIWSLITGVVGLLSFLMTINEKFYSFRKYTIPAAWILTGFALGRISYIGTLSITNVNASFDGDFSLTVIIFTLLLFLSFVSFLFIRVGNDGMAYMIFLLGIILLPNKIIDMRNAYSDELTYNDYLQLAEIKVKNKNYDSAIMFFENAKENSKNENLKAEIDKKIDLVYKKSVSSE